MPRDGRRDPTKEKFWRRRVFGQAKSGLSIRAWCREHDLREPAFYWWRARLARTGRGRKARSRKPTFVPVHVSAQETTSVDGPIEIVLAAGRRIRVRGPVDRQMLADVLAVLEAPPC
jgi:transposase-like protein